MKYIRFQDVASSANVASTFYYVPVNDITYVLTASTTVTLHISGVNIDGNNDDKIVITCTAGDEQKISDMLLLQANHMSQGGVLTVDKDFYGTSISDISSAVG